MRSSARMLIPLCVAFLHAGCDTSFNPKTDFREQFVLQCFVTGEVGKPPSTVNALVAKVYDVDGFDPSVNTVDPSIGGATLSFSINGKSYTMRDSLRFTADSVRYGSRQRFYYGRMPAPSPSDAISIVARLPNGRILSAQTVVPQTRAVTTNFDFPRGVTTQMNFPPAVRNWTLQWESDEVTDPHLFFPRLMILFTKLVDGEEEAGAVDVPLKYVAGANGPWAVYPSFTMQTSCTFDFASIDSAMASISAGDPDKARYAAHVAWFYLIEFDSPLSKYYSSVHGSLDEFSIRVDQLVYSNIGGGIGIFGSSFMDRAQFDLDIYYVRSFGYRYR